MPQKNKRDSKDEERAAWRAVRAAREKFEDARDTTSDFVREKPFTSIAIAAAVGAGVALGVAALVGRQRERRRTFWDNVRDIF